MINKCEHCGQTVMATDSQCWHCGRLLRPGKPGTPTKQPQLATAVPETNPPMPSLATILLYVGLTAVSLLILVATTRAIGQAPLFLFGSNTITPRDWRPITDRRLLFTLNVPETWQSIDLERASEAPALKSSPPISAVTDTFASLVADTELILLAAEDTAVFPTGSPVFVLIAQSQRLQQLSADEIISYAHQQLPLNITIVEENTLPNPKNLQTQKGVLLIEIQQGERVWSCLEHFVPASHSTYLVVTCTSFAKFPAHLNDFEAILRSFQPLDS